MTRLLATTAIALLAAGPLYAQAQDAQSGQPATPAATPAMAGDDALFVTTQDPSDMLSSNLVGMDVYSSATDYEADYGDNQTVPADARADWDDIGEVNDLLISQDGTVEAVLVDVGGFLEMGEHTVAMSMDEINVLTDETGARFVALNTSREALEAAPEFEPLPPPTPAPAADATGVAPAAPAGTMVADMPPADDGTMAADDDATMAADDTTMAPAADETMAADSAMAPGAEGFVPLGVAEVTAETLEGATVYSSQGESIGDISELVMGTDGKVTDVVVDVGGFLGMGEHSVALGFDELQVMTNPETDEVRVYISATKQELEQRPEYEAG